MLGGGDGNDHVGEAQCSDGVCSIQYSPVWRCLREELEWPLVDILQARLLLSSVGGGVRLSPVSAGEQWGGEGGGGGGRGDT